MEMGEYGVLRMRFRQLESTLEGLKGRGNIVRALGFKYIGVTCLFVVVTMVTWGLFCEER